MRSKRIAELSAKCPKADGIQHIGMRLGQQDAFYISSKACWNQKGLFSVLADGMGGMQQGELASLRAIQMLKRFFESLGTVAMEDIPRLLLEWTYSVNETIYADYVAGQDIDCGTTLLAVWIMGTGMHFLSVGDSRIYLGRRSEWFVLNEDHTYRNLLYRDVISGIGTAEEVRENTSGHALSSYIGGQNVKQIDCSKNALETEVGDVLLLCSDGFYSALEKGNLWKKAADENLPLTALMQSVLDLRLPHQDNATVIRIRL